MEWKDYHYTYLPNLIIQYCIRFLTAYNVSATSWKRSLSQNKIPRVVATVHYFWVTEMQRLTFLCSRAGEGQEEKGKEDKVSETCQHQSCYSNQLLKISEDFFFLLFSTHQNCNLELYLWDLLSFLCDQNCSILTAVSLRFLITLNFLWIPKALCRVCV